MIHYALQCASGHAFDGWFKDSASYDTQAATQLIACPHCDSTAITRALMAPALSRSARHAAGVTAPPGPPSAEPATTPAPPAPAGSNTTPVTGHTLPSEVRAVLQRLRSEVEKHCDYVGADFAEEARRIHYGEAETRGIYGETTRDEAEALHEEGVVFGVMPWLPRSDS